MGKKKKKQQEKKQIRFFKKRKEMEKPDYCSDTRGATDHRSFLHDKSKNKLLSS